MAAGDWKDLLNAVHHGDLSLVRYHVQNGVDVNYQHPEFLTTVLIASIEVRQQHIAQYLLENGADPHLAAGFSNDTAFVVARRYKDPEVIALLKPYQQSLWQRISVRLGFDKGNKS